MNELLKRLKYAVAKPIKRIPNKWDEVYDFLTIESQVAPSFCKSEEELIEYKIGVTFSQFCTCKEEELPYMQKLILSAIVTEIYGKINDELYNLESAIFARDFERAKESSHTLRSLTRIY